MSEPSNAKERANFKQRQIKASIKNIPFELTFEEFQALRKISVCYYTEKTLNKELPLNPLTWSLDRKDNRKGYTSENTVVCSHEVNLKKASLFDEKREVPISPKDQIAHQIKSKLMSTKPLDHENHDPHYKSECKVQQTSFIPVWWGEVMAAISLFGFATLSILCCIWITIELWDKVGERIINFFSQF